MIWMVLKIRPTIFVRRSSLFEGIAPERKVQRIAQKPQIRQVIAARLGNHQPKAAGLFPKLRIRCPDSLIFSNPRDFMNTA
ncbi:MAG: hypothetical protein RLZZ398_970 [Verrucomicrobiota bacterium]